MPKINEAERRTQDRVLKLFKDTLSYAYYGDLRDRINSNIDAEKLTAWLVGHGYSRTLVGKAVFELQRVAGNLQQGNSIIFKPSTVARTRWCCRVIKQF